MHDRLLAKIRVRGMLKRAACTTPVDRLYEDMPMFKQAWDWGSIKNAYNSTVNGVKNAYNSTVGWVGDKINGVKNAWNTTKEFIGNLGKGIDMVNNMPKMLGGVAVGLGGAMLGRAFGGAGAGGGNGQPAGQAPQQLQQQQPQMPTNSWVTWKNAGKGFSNWNSTNRIGSIK